MTTKVIQEPLQTEAEIATWAGYSKHWFKKKRLSGEGGPPFVQKPGCKVFYHPEVVRKWLKKHGHTPIDLND